MYDIGKYILPFHDYCYRATQFFKKKGSQYREIDVEPESDRKSEIIARAHGNHTVPQIFVFGNYVGRCNELYALDQDGNPNGILKGLRGPD